MSAHRRICLGAFAGAHGVKGEAKVKTFTETEAGVAEYGPVDSEDGKRRFRLKFIRVLKPGIALVSAPEIESREDAAALAGTRLYVDRARLPQPDDDEFYVEDLVGLAAVTDAGTPLGKVSSVDDFGAGPVIEIEKPEGRKGPLLLPFTLASVPVVDIAGGRIVIAAGALEEIVAGEADDGEG